MAYATHCIPWDESCAICNPEPLRNPDGSGPEWGEPRHAENATCLEISRMGCRCRIRSWSGERILTARLCDAHDFASLDSGRRKLNSRLRELYPLADSVERSQ